MKEDGGLHGLLGVFMNWIGGWYFGRVGYLQVYSTYFHPASGEWITNDLLRLMMREIPD